MNGLTLELFIGSAVDNNNMLSTENGFNIFINDERIDSVTYEGISLPTGFTTNIEMKKHSIEKVPKPYSECTGDLTTIDAYKSECYKRTFSRDKPYHYNDCSKTCFNKYSAEVCGCQRPYYRKYYDNVRNCDGVVNYIEDYQCVPNALLTFVQTPSILNACDCPIECESSFYQHSISLADFPTYKYANYLMNNSQLIKAKFPNQTLNRSVFQDLRQSVAKVNIFFDDFVEIIIPNR